MKIKNMKFLEGVSVVGNTINNVHICGLLSANGYSYDPKALQDAVAMYEKADVFANHKDKRLVEDKIGWLEGIFFVEGSGLWAKKLTLNEKHPIYEQTLWWADKNPSKIGLSHSVEGKLNEEKKLVEAITLVESVDLVAQPATVAGLHESVSEKTPSKIRLDTLVNAAYDLAAKTCWSQLAESEKRDSLHKLFQELLEEIKPPKKDDTQMELKDLTFEMLLKERPDLVTKVSEAARAIETRISEALAKVPEKARTASFQKQLRAVSNDEAAIKELVEDRVAVVEATQVESKHAPAPEAKKQADEAASLAKIAEEVKKALA